MFINVEQNKNMNKNSLTVMPDFCSSGIWKKNDGSMVDFKELKLSADLIKEFEDWIDFYDRKCHTPRHYSFLGEKAEELNNRGRVLAKKLKTVYPDIQIFYRGEVDGDMLDHEEILI